MPSSTQNSRIYDSGAEAPRDPATDVAIVDPPPLKPLALAWYWVLVLCGVVAAGSFAAGAFIGHHFSFLGPWMARCAPIPTYRSLWVYKAKKGALACGQTMSDAIQYLDTFPLWLKSLGEDAKVLSAVLKDEGNPDGARRLAAGGLNYLFKSLDLIPDGVEDLGYLDDAFVLRVCAKAISDAEGKGDEGLATLSKESGLIERFLEDDFSRLGNYVQGLSKGAARGRTVDEIMEDAKKRAALLSEVEAWADSYAAPTFNRDENTLVKMRSYLRQKLPR